MKELFLKNVPDFGSLYYKHIFIQFEGVPISFICLNDRGQIFLVHCSEIRSQQRWIITLISRLDLHRLIQQNCSIYQVLTRNDAVVLAVDLYQEEGDIIFSTLKSNEIDHLDLPDKGLLLDFFDKDSAMKCFGISEFHFQNTEILVHNSNISQTNTYCSKKIKKVFSEEFTAQSSDGYFVHRLLA